MKTKLILTLAVMASTLAALNARAATVNFIEGAEGQPLTIGFDPREWLSALPAVASPESGRFTGVVIPQGGNLGSGSFTYGLQEVVGGPLSDWVTVSWDSVPYTQQPGAFITTFTMDFQSDIEGQILPPPPAPFVVELETGGLQQFRIPLTGAPFDLTVGIQSDGETTTVPDGGATIMLLGLSSAGLAAFRRFRK